MPVKLYVGKPRNGKTYEVATHVIYNALKAGRRVVSNIAGLNYELYKELILAEGVPLEKIGTIVNVSHEDVLKPHFFITDYFQREGIQSFIQAGDVVCLDEVWRFWKKRGELLPEHDNFFRTHGHHTHEETGFIIDIALISQSVRDFNENIRAVAAETYLMRKLQKLGMSSAYTVDIFDGASNAKSDHVLQLMPRKYNKNLFALYSSHSQKKEGGASANEDNIDKRGNILKGKIFVALAVFVFVAGFAFYVLWGFFHPKPKEEGAKIENVPTAQNQTIQQAAPVNNSLPQASPKTWRVVGHYKVNNQLTLVLENSQGITRYLPNPQNFRFDGLNFEAILNDGVFTNYIYEKQTNNAPTTPNPASNF